ncbi:MAG: AIM24 family protein [Tissierellia bacterium]|nr:AIM24 family protein [Tissierellia bacterium]
MEYSIEGGHLPVVRIQMEQGDSLISQGGGKSWFKGPVETINEMKGGLKGGLGRVFSGESLMLSTYVAHGPAEIAFASSFPGSIIPLDLGPGQSIIAQRGAFLCATQNVSLSTHFQERLGAGLFGGEGFIMEKITGPGTCFLELDGHAVTYQLAPGEEMVVDTGALAIMSETCTMSIQRVKGVKNIFFGGEGLFETIIRGPGQVHLQSMPLPKIAGLLARYMPKKDK